MKAKYSVLTTLALTLLFGFFLWLMALKSFQELGFEKTAKVIAFVAVSTFVIATAMFRWIGRDWVSHVLTLLVITGVWGALLEPMPKSIMKISAVIGKFVKVATTETISEVALFIVIGLLVCALNWVIDQYGVARGLIVSKSWFKRSVSKMVVPVTLLSLVVIVVHFGDRRKPSSIVANTPEINIEKINNISVDSEGYPTAWIERLKTFENAPLVTGKIKVSSIEKDALVTTRTVNQVGYGITGAEISAAKEYGFLPKDAKLPKTLTKAEADEWMKKITIPTYEKQVEAVVKTPLTKAQKFALLSFCHNLGIEQLRLLVNQPGRLNDGNFHATCKAIELYNRASGVEHSGLAKRRAWEAGLFASDMSNSTEAKPPFEFD